MKNILFTLSLCFLSFIGNSQELKTIIIHSADSIYAEDVQSKLEELLIFDEKNTFDLRTGTPHVDSLLQYSSVLVFPNLGFPNPVAIGDSLAKYVDLGGAVVDAAFSEADLAPSRLGGNFEDYNLMSPFEYNVLNATVLSDVVELGHPIMNNINSFSTARYSYTGIIVKPNVHVVAQYSNGSPVVLTQENVGPASTRRVFLNFFPPSYDFANDTHSWDASTDGSRIIANALLWAAHVEFPLPEYCSSHSTRNSFEWIKRVELEIDFGPIIPEFYINIDKCIIKVMNHKGN